MVDITATVEVAKFRTTSDRSSVTNSEGSLKRQQNYEAELEILLEPHPNLDAYDPAVEGELSCVAQLIESYAGGLDDNEELVSVEDYKMHGSYDQWIEQAEAFASERPDMSVDESLTEFGRWSCTDGRRLAQVSLEHRQA
jgi:hypothetical protein